MGYILIVDDETTITDIIEFNLQKEGFYPYRQVP